MITYNYKLQGNGSDSWQRTSGGIVDMVLDIEVFTWKLKAILTNDGLLTQVETEINNLPEPTKNQALLAWEQSPKISITSNTTKLIQQALSLTIEQVTDIFERSQNLEI